MGGGEGELCTHNYHIRVASKREEEGRERGLLGVLQLRSGI
jgi:hypothetical protein